MQAATGYTRKSIALPPRLVTAPPAHIAAGVWLLRGGFPHRSMNVYAIEDDGSVTLYDGGIRQMADALVRSGNAMGGIKRVVIGHAHADHRGSVPFLGAPSYCHPAEAPDAAGDGGMHYIRIDRALPAITRPLVRPLMRRWDGGPVELAGHLEEGDEVAGFEVVHLPGHTPGSIALWRRADRIALTSDCFYTHGWELRVRRGARLPSDAFTVDMALARESLRKLAALEPRSAWPGHGRPVLGDVRTQLERAAAGSP